MSESAPRLRVYVCGRLAVEYGPVVLPEAAFPARQGRRLWVYLTLHRQRPVARDDLAVAVWGDAVPDAWNETLNALVSRLRRALRPLACPGLDLRGEGGRYHLALPPDAFVDYVRARDALHRADVLMARGDHGAALAEARVAMEIAGRGLLPGEGGPWVEGARRLLAETRLHALEHTAEAELRRGRPAAAEREAEALVALDPLRESSHRLLMRALAAGGNAAGALRVLAECRRVLAEHGGMTPSPATERLCRELTGGAPVLDRPPHAPPDLGRAPSGDR